MNEQTLIQVKNDNTDNPAVFETILGDILQLNQGDYLTLQQAFLRTGTSTGLFNFTTDQTISINFGFWEQYDTSDTDRG